MMLTCWCHNKSDSGEREGGGGGGGGGFLSVVGRGESLSSCILREVLVLG